MITGVLLSIVLAGVWVAKVNCDTYTAVGRLGHTAVLVNDR